MGRKRPELRPVRGLAARGVLWTLLVLLPAAPDAAEKTVVASPEKINLAYSSISGNMAPLWAAYEGGFFQNYGLDVQLIFVEGGPRAIQTLISGDATMAQVAGSAVVQANLRGSDVVLIGGVLNTFDYQFIVDKGITRPDHLKGKAVAVSRFGSSSDFATRYALERFGLVPERDVRIVQIGSQPARFAALEEGKIQGLMLSVPFTLRAKKAGFPVLADLQMLGLEYQHTGLATTRSLIASRPDLVRRVMKAYVEGIHFYKSHPKEALAILQKYLKSYDIESLRDTYETIGLTLIPERPYPTLRGVQTILHELSEKEPKARSARPEQFVETSFLRDLDRSGFIDRLYKAKAVIASREKQPRDSVPATVKQTTRNLKATVSIRRKGKEVSPSPTLLSVPAAGREPREYTVKAGDNLSRLAERFYGAQWRWGRIYAANLEVIKNPDYIYIGQKILIPPDGEKET